MARRIGFYTLKKLAMEMCKYVVQFSPLIRAAYPNNATLLAALDAANAACGLLAVEIDLVDGEGV